MSIQIVDKIDWSTIDFVLCAENGYFKDDKHGLCAKCGKNIVYRPYIPDDVMKLCLECGNNESIT